MLASASEEEDADPGKPLARALGSLIPAKLAKLQTLKSLLSPGPLEAPRQRGKAKDIEVTFRVGFGEEDAPELVTGGARPGKGRQRGGRQRRRSNQKQRAEFELLLDKREREGECKVAAWRKPCRE